MTYGGFGNRPSDPFSSDPFGGNAFGHPPIVSAPPPQQQPGEVNTFATLSVVFAIIFAPVGALLGHLGLSQIARTGQRGRDRALVGITLSYTFITVAVAALVVWAVTAPDTPSTASAPTATTIPSTTRATTLPPALPPPPPPPPTVAEEELPALLLPLDEMKAITGDAGLVVHKDFHDVDMPPTSESIYEPLDCMGSFLAAATPAYQGFNQQKLYGNVQQNADSLLQVVQSVAIFTNAAAAQKARADYVAQWTRCAGTTLTWTMPAEGRALVAPCVVTSYPCRHSPCIQSVNEAERQSFTPSTVCTRRPVLAYWWIASRQYSRAG